MRVPGRFDPVPLSGIYPQIGKTPEVIGKLGFTLLRHPGESLQWEPLTHTQEKQTMNTHSRYLEVTQTATEPGRNWSNRDLVRFHYFNPNGLFEQKRQTDEQITKLVDEGKAKSGSIIAYGSLNYYYADKLAKMIDKQRVNRIAYAITVKGLRDDIAKAKQFIDSVNK
jgi:hypothetical protein